MINGIHRFFNIEFMAQVGGVGILIHSIMINKLLSNHSQYGWMILVYRHINVYAVKLIIVRHLKTKS